MLCSLTRYSKKEKNSEKKKVRFTDYTKNTWIDDSSASCHITNDESGMYDVIDIGESIQGSSGIMPITKNGKLRVTVHKVNGKEQVHTLWPVKFCFLAGANLFLLTCELSRRNKISSDDANNIVVITQIGNIVVNHQIKTRDCWVTGVDFFRNKIKEKAVSATAIIK